MKPHRTESVKESEEPAHKLYEAIASLRSREEAKMFFEDLCTPTELQAMADRWLVVEEIKKGKPYREIYDETGVSVTTVGRVARHIMLGHGGYNLVFERQEKRLHENKYKNKSRNTKKRKAK